MASKQLELTNNTEGVDIAPTPVTFPNVITGPSGIEYEFTESLPKHQRLLMEAKNGRMADRLLMFLVGRYAKNEYPVHGCLVRVGSTTIHSIPKEQRMEFARSIPSQDRNDVLIAIRKYTLENDSDFDFNLDYESIKDETKGEKKTATVTGVLSYERESYKTFGAGLDEKGYPVLIESTATELSDFKNSFIVTMPKSKRRVKFGILDGHSEKRMSTVKRDELTPNTEMEARNPVIEVTVNAKGEPLKEPVWTRLDIDNHNLRDNEYLRRCMKMVEGKSRAVVTYTHPEASEMPEGEGTQTFDALGDPAFFYPSAAV